MKEIVDYRMARIRIRSPSCELGIVENDVVGGFDGASSVDHFTAPCIGWHLVHHRDAYRTVPAITCATSGRGGRVGRAVSIDACSGVEG